MPCSYIIQLRQNTPIILAIFLLHTTLNKEWELSLLIKTISMNINITTIKFPLIGLFLLACLLSITSCEKKPAATQSALSVEVIKIQKSTIAMSKEYIGQTSSLSNVTIRARVQGYLQSFNFLEGSIVKKGDLLYVIEPEPFKAAVDAAKGALAQSVATAEFDRLDAERKLILYHKQAVSEQDSDQATATYKAALGNIETNKANLLQAQINLSYCYVYSPSDGMIGENQIDPGNLVGGTEATELATVVQLNPISVIFYPSVNDYNGMLQFKHNMPFKVIVTLPQQKGYKFTGKVDLINNQVDSTTSTLLMRSVVDNPNNLLLPGIYVNVKLLLGNASNIILVPSTAVMTEQNMQFVYVVNAENEVVANPIQTSMQYKNYLVVVSGLKAGDLVITTNLQKIRPGMKVIPELNKS